MDKPFDAFKKKHGSPQACQASVADGRQRYADVLPPALLSEWETSGWCRYGDGLLWLVNPADYTEVLRDWVPNPEAYSVIARTAFGCLLLWDGQQAYLLDVLYDALLPMLDSIEELFDGFLCDDQVIEQDLRKADFEAAVQRLGILKADECYGFIPPLSLGGAESPDQLQRVKLREYLALLAQSH